MILHKQLINVLRENEIKLITKDSYDVKSSKMITSPWILPGYDFTNLINQFNIFTMITSGKKTNKNNNNSVNLNEKDSYNLVKWDIYNPTVKRNLDLFFNDYVIQKINDYKNKIKQFKSNLISLKQVRKAEKCVSNSYEGMIMSVQSYGFFVEIPDLGVEGLVHVSTLNNDWYEYRAKQNLLVGRKSKTSYKIGDKINIKIIKVDILKYQIDLEINNNT